MSIIDTLTVWLPNAQNTRSAGRSLAQSLYAFPLDLWLLGDLGSGKTTFLQGLAKGLGIEGPVLSPTFALEQRAMTATGTQFLHIDLYRLTSAHARALLEESDAHEGIRCVEWAERLEKIPPGRRIILRFADAGTGRSVKMTFDDVALPTAEDIRAWRAEMRTPAIVARHCNTVATVAERCADALIERGIVVRRLALRRAAEAHDLLRFVNFVASAHHEPHTHSPDDEAHWESFRRRYQGLTHEAAAASFLREREFDALADIVAVHGVRLPPPPFATIEQKLLYYADKRVAADRIVSIDERFADFRKRYGPSHDEESEIWKQEAHRIEAGLFPDGPPV